MAGPVGRERASCHHTEPDWARYVRAPGEGWPIFAGCRLLVKEGELADDPRTIACTFWGRQPDCPVYEGPAKPAAPAVAAEAAPAPPSVELPLTERQMAAARLPSDDYARRGPLTDAVRQRRRASGAAALALLLALAALAFWLAR